MLGRCLSFFMVLMCLETLGESRADEHSTKPNWVVLEGGAQIKGVQVGRFMNHNWGFEAGYLTYSPRAWQISSSRNTIQIYSAMIRTSYGAFRAGIGPAYRTTAGSERCKYDIFDPTSRQLSYVLGPPITWEMKTLDVESTIGFSWPISDFRLGLNVITWGRQVALFSFEAEGPDTMMSDSQIQQIEEELQKDTYTVMTATIGLVF